MGVLRHRSVADCFVNNCPEIVKIFFFAELILYVCFTKGQSISKADWRAIDSFKKQTDEFVLFAFLLFTANKSNSSVHFLGESTARQSAFRFFLTFRNLRLHLFLTKIIV